MKQAEGKLTVDIQASANGRVRKATITILNEEREVLHTDQANLQAATERTKLAKRAAEKLDVDAGELLQAIEDEWHKLQGEWRRAKEAAAAGSPDATSEIQVELLDMAPATISRPLCLLDGCAYAATWCQVRQTVSRTVDPQTGHITPHDPPLVTVENVLLILRDDGELFTKAALPGARPLADLGLLVHLPTIPRADQLWSGAGVRRYRNGQRPGPVGVFERIIGVFDRFLDFARSLAPQRTMCELMACSVLSTYLLDAFNVAGYVFSNGERGSGKTALLDTHVHMAYLGELILAGSSFAALRDLADYGATLAFDDAENVMDLKRGDPDKRTMLLAGSRRGATVTVKELVGERWVTRHVSTFCNRLFSAIRLPDPVLGSRSIITPMVRSHDPHRATATPADLEQWPCDRRQLVDDLWAIGLEHLPRLPAHDRAAADESRLMGRCLDPWRPILAVAHWLQQEHGVSELFTRLEQLAVDYQGERGDYEDADGTRILYRALLVLSRGLPLDEDLTIQPKQVADEMNRIAREDSLVEQGQDFTTARRVGIALKRLRFRRPAQRNARSKRWLVTLQEIRAACSAYGVEVEADADCEGEAPSADEVPF